MFSRVGESSSSRLQRKRMSIIHQTISGAIFGSSLIIAPRVIKGERGKTLLVGELCLIRAGDGTKENLLVQILLLIIQRVFLCQILPR